MKTNLVLLVFMILIPVIHTSKEHYIGTSSLSQKEQVLRYNFDYTCNGERAVIIRCRKDSDIPGVAPTQPNDDYCLVSYPDRPKQGGFTVQTTVLRGDLIKKLQACGALSADGQKVEGSTQPQSTSTGPNTKNPGKSFTGQTWEYHVDAAPTYSGGGFGEPNAVQQLLNQRAAEGWQFIPFAGQRLLYFKRAR